jgi:quinol monooxygenase YgiN
LDALLQNAAIVREQPGCIEYVPVVDAIDGGTMQTLLGDDTLMVVEKWETLEALYAHSQGAHMAEYRAKAGHLVTERAIHILTAA